LELKGKKVRYTWQKPFDVIANYASRMAWLPSPKINISFHVRIDNSIAKIIDSFQENYWFLKEHLKLMNAAFKPHAF